MAAFLHVTGTYQVAYESGGGGAILGNVAVRDLTATLLNGGSLRNTVNFVSALSFIIIVKLPDLLAFPVMLLFSSLSFLLKIACGGAYTSRNLPDYENIHGGDSFMKT